MTKTHSNTILLDQTKDKQVENHEVKWAKFKFIYKFIICPYNLISSKAHMELVIPLRNYHT